MGAISSRQHGRGTQGGPQWAPLGRWARRIRERCGEPRGWLLAPRQLAAPRSRRPEAESQDSDAAPIAQGVRGVGVGEGRPRGTRALVRERSRGALPPPSSSRESPRPPSALPGRSLGRRRQAGLWQPSEDQHPARASAE